MWLIGVALFPMTERKAYVLISGRYQISTGQWLILSVKSVKSRIVKSIVFPADRRVVYEEIQSYWRLSWLSKLTLTSVQSSVGSVAVLGSLWTTPPQHTHFVQWGPVMSASPRSPPRQLWHRCRQSWEDCWARARPPGRRRCGDRSPSLRTDWPSSTTLTPGVGSPPTISWISNMWVLYKLFHSRFIRGEDQSRQLFKDLDDNNTSVIIIKLSPVTGQTLYLSRGRKPLNCSSGDVTFQSPFFYLCWVLEFQSVFSMSSQPWQARILSCKDINPAGGRQAGSVDTLYSVMY